jgi:hypothetical protein
MSKSSSGFADNDDEAKGSSASLSLYKKVRWRITGNEDQGLWAQSRERRGELPPSLRDR